MNYDSFDVSIPLCEAYWGRDEQLDEIVKIANKIAEVIKKERIPKTNMTFTGLNKNLESAIKKKFGFKKVEIVWPDESARGANAFTIVSAMILANKRNFAITPDTKKKGYYDKKHAHTCLLSIYLPLVRDIGMTGEELVAIILHEIGHNFDTSMYVWMTYVSEIFRTTLEFFMNKIPGYAISKALQIANGPKGDPQDPGSSLGVMDQIPIQLPTTQDIVKGQLIGSSIGLIVQNLPPVRWLTFRVFKLKEYLMDNIPFLRHIHTILLSVRDATAYAQAIGGVIGSAISLPINIIFSPVRALLDMPTRKKEIFADSFATAYGFGPQMVSALNKLDLGGSFVYRKNNSEVVADASDPAIRFMADITQANWFLTTLFVNGGHGTTGARLAKILAKVRREAADIHCSPETKAELLSQVDDIEQSFETYLRADVNGVKLGFTAWVRGVVMDMCHNDTDLMANLFPDHEA